MLRIAVLLLLLLAVAGCRSPFDVHGEEARVRLHNDSEHHLDHVRFSTGTEPISLGRLDAGTYSSWRRVAVVYDIAYVEAVIAGEIYTSTSQAAQFASSGRLPAGVYTLRVTVDEARHLLHVAIVED